MKLVTFHMFSVVRFNDDVGCLYDLVMFRKKVLEKRII